MSEICRTTAVMQPAFIFHDLRRSFAKDATDAGNDPKTVMDIGGWETISTFHRYKIVDKRGRWLEPSAGSRRLDGRT